MRARVLACLLMSGLLLSAHPGWAQDPGAGQPAASSPPADPKVAAEKAEDEAMLRLLGEGAQLMRSGQPRQAIETYDKIIATYEARYQDSKEKLYCANGMAETLAYMLLAANQKQAARALAPTWAVAYFMKGYALVELRDTASAKAALEKARDLSPYNPHFLNELANIYKGEKNWPLALETYQAAKEHVAAFAMPQLKDKDETAALHGIAFVYSETGKLDEAETIYKQCLEKNPQDTYAQSELNYIAQQRAKQAQVR